MKQKFLILTCFAVIFASLLGSSVYASATPSGLPTVPKSDKPHALTVVYDTKDNITKAVVFYNESGNEISISFKQHGYQILAKRLTETSVLRYMYKLSGDTWIEDGVGVLGSTDSAFEHNFNSWIYSDFDIYNTNGELVFQVPPAVSALEIAVTEGLTDLQTETLTTMKTLTLCGVGLMALLVGLVLLPKILYRFL